MRQSSPSIVVINHGPFVCFSFFIFSLFYLGRWIAPPSTAPGLEAAEGQARLDFPRYRGGLSLLCTVGNKTDNRASVLLLAFLATEAIFLAGCVGLCRANFYRQTARRFCGGSVGDNANYWPNFKGG